MEDSDQRTVDDRSVLSYSTEGFAQRWIQEVNGRAFNTINDSYLFPSDEIEWERLDKQHSALTVSMGLTPCPDIVNAILAPREGDEKNVLDLGCGTGTWALEMARKYPHANIIGVDLSPPPLDQEVVPGNLSFEIDDINHGLEHFYNKFDVVHVRCLTLGIDDYAFFMEDCQKCLKPGGLVIFMEGDHKILSHDQLHPLQFPGSGYPGQVSWFRKVVYEAFEVSDLDGTSGRPGEELLDQGLWNHPLCDPATAVGGSVILPIGPWATDRDPGLAQRLMYSGALMRQVFLNVHRGYHSAFLKHGLQQDVIDEWSKKADEELNSMDVKTWVRFRFCWARKRAGLNQPAPPLPIPPALNHYLYNNQPNALPSSATSSYMSGYGPVGSTSSLSIDAMSTDENVRLQYPYIFYFQNPRDMAFEVERRKRAAQPPPPSDVRRAWERKELEEMMRM